MTIEVSEALISTSTLCFLFNKKIGLRSMDPFCQCPVFEPVFFASFMKFRRAVLEIVLHYYLNLNIEKKIKEIEIVVKIQIKKLLEFY